MSERLTDLHLFSFHIHTLSSVEQRLTTPAGLHWQNLNFSDQDRTGYGVPGPKFLRSLRISSTKPWLWSTIHKSKFQRIQKLLWKDIANHYPNKAIPPDYISYIGNELFVTNMFVEQCSQKMFVTILTPTRCSFSHWNIFLLTLSFLKFFVLRIVSISFDFFVFFAKMVFSEQSFSFIPFFKL